MEVCTEFPLEEENVIIMFIMWLINTATGRNSSCFITLRVTAAQYFDNTLILTQRELIF